MPYFILHITLQGTTNPVVWRTVQLPASISFYKLHKVIQTAFGWKEMHLHAFELPAHPGVVITHPDYVDDDDREIIDEKNAKLKDYLHAAGESLRYVYDFGDDWQHIITVVQVLWKWRVDNRNIFLAAEGRCPPEDIGGPPGFARFKETIADKHHPEYRHYKDWMAFTGEKEFNPWDVGLERKVIQFMGGRL